MSAEKLNTLVEAVKANEVALTVADLAALTDMSATKVRELVNGNPAIFSKSDDKPYTVFLSAAEESDESDPDELAACPQCGAETLHSSGEEGTFLGDTAFTCEACGTTFNKFTGETIVVAKPKKEGGAKRVGNLNPQPAINKKKEAATAAGGSIGFQNREWTFYGAPDGEGDSNAITTVSSKQFSCLSPEDVTVIINGGDLSFLEERYAALPVPVEAEAEAEGEDELV